MVQNENQKFGEFLMQLRKEKNLTQKELGERLFVSDKTVSKWERGLSMPSVSLLIPIADIFGVTVTELLKGERISNQLTIEEVEALVTSSIDLSAEEKGGLAKSKKWWLIGYLAAVAIVIIELLVMFILKLNVHWNDVLLVEGLGVLFGAWLCCLAKEQLPTYYDEHKISYVSDGVFRLNLIGLSFNNSNWKPILVVCRCWVLVMCILFPILNYLYVGVFQLGDGLIERLGVLLLVCLGIFVPLYYVGKRYE